MRFMGIGFVEIIVGIVALGVLFIFGYFAQKSGKKKGYNPAGCFLAGFFFHILGLVVILLLPDKNEGKSNNVNDLLEYKKLLDAGVITQEEFDAKKKELL